MLKDLISSRLIQGGLAVCVLIVVGSFLYMRHVKSERDRAIAETEARVKAHEARQKQQQDTGGTSSVDFGEAEPPGLDAKVPHAVSTSTAEHSPSETAAETRESAETRETDTGAADAPDPSKMSRFGLGPYPEIPKEWGWIPNYWETCESIEDELLTRVIIKMHNEGIRDKYSSVGINHGTGLVTPIEYGSLLVEYETDENGDQRLVRTKGHPDLAPPGGVYTHVSEIPSHIKIVTAEEVSFDPYEYLGLSR